MIATVTHNVHTNRCRLLMARADIAPLLRLMVAADTSLVNALNR